MEVEMLTMCIHLCGYISILNVLLYTSLKGIIVVILKLCCSCLELKRYIDFHIKSLEIVLLMLQMLGIDRKPKKLISSISLI